MFAVYYVLRKDAFNICHKVAGQIAERKADGKDPSTDFVV